MDLAATNKPSNLKLKASNAILSKKQYKEIKK